MVLHETEEPGVVEACFGELCQVWGEVLELEHIHCIQSVWIGGNRWKFSHMALAVTTSGEIASPKTVLVNLFHWEKVICEDCQVDFFVTDLLSYCSEVLAHSWMLNIKVSFLSLKETHDITNEPKSVLCVPVSKIKTPCYHHIIKLVWISNILHALNKLLPKSCI